MATISAKDVNKLRQITGVGMMDCKSALQECEGDIEKAIDHLRKKGQKLANKRADRSANEGIVLAKVSPDHKYGAIMMLNCETDFVAKNQGFIDFAQEILNLAVDKQAKCLDCVLSEKMANGLSVEESITEQVGKTGEKLVLSKFESIFAEAVIPYNHHGNRLGTLLGVNKSGEEAEKIGYDLAMQIAAMNPVSVDVNGVPQEVLDRELEVGKEQARLEGKPEQMLDKIAEGRLNKFLKENTLMQQEYIKDNKVTVRQYMDAFDKEFVVITFKRFILGE